MTRWGLPCSRSSDAGIAASLRPRLREASGVIANCYLRLDPQEWIRAVEKRRAALGGLPE
jgi:hypothetical protein